jgi:hypothetical protein
LKKNLSLIEKIIENCDISLNFDIQNQVILLDKVNNRLIRTVNLNTIAKFPEVGYLGEILMHLCEKMDVQERILMLESVGN